MDEGDRRLDTLLERIDLLRHELEVIGRRMDRLEGLNRIADELHELNSALQTLAYAALGRRGPDVRRKGCPANRGQTPNGGRHGSVALPFGV